MLGILRSLSRGYGSKRVFGGILIGAECCGRERQRARESDRCWASASSVDQSQAKWAAFLVRVIFCERKTRLSERPRLRVAGEACHESFLSGCSA